MRPSVLAYKQGTPEISGPLVHTFNGHATFTFSGMRLMDANVSMVLRRNGRSFFWGWRVLPTLH
jgi:hypothetical protein